MDNARQVPLKVQETTTSTGGKVGAAGARKELNTVQRCFACLIEVPRKQFLFTIQYIKGSKT